MMLTKALLPKKFNPPPSFERKMFEISHIYSVALSDNLVNCPFSGEIIYQMTKELKKRKRKEKNQTPIHKDATPH